MRKLVPFALALAAVCPASTATVAGDSRPALSRYEEVRRTRDGIGKAYFGREIAQVMGHQGAGWLERPEREGEERTDLLLDALALQDGECVADIGAGTGYMSWRIAQRIGRRGRVLAVDVQPEMLELLATNMRSRHVDDIVKPVLGTPEDPRLPAGGVDTILLVDVYHEFDFPYEMTRAMVQALKPGGRLVLVEYRGEDPRVPIKPLHKMTVRQVQAEMSVHPIVFDHVSEVLPRQHIIIFRKEGEKRN